MHPILERVFETGRFTNCKNEAIVINSETPRGQCEFLQQLIRERCLSSSVEIGMAYGTSSLAIAEALKENKGRGVVIDPFENSYWNGSGLDLLRQAGLDDTVDFYEEYSYETLPRLLSQGHRIDFAYIDSTKLTDWLMVDFFFIDKMLALNGVIVFDDVTYPSIRKLVRYIIQLPHYRLCGNWPGNRKLSGIRKMIKSSLTLGLKDGPSLKDIGLGLYSRCVALEKVGEDSRKYDWHVKF